ncbi:MAG TPA: hypothetical protein DDW84_02555 [Phycisphaerales bacterium]|nr:MAG: hypothetical protein A2Y13_05790 [Planctomycetes bacterium GWC2_45_44]HBG77719.1 hypothetical protein [Phycisphaerales bacterium]HBR20421.1 hypothetical protein [Phycisphaerales bacterium]
MSDNCPVCKTVLNKKKSTQNSAFSTYAYDCPRCGKFVFTFNESVLAMKLNYGNDDFKGFVLSHNIRKMQKNDSEVLLNNDMVEQILKGTLPKPAEQKNIFIRWVGDNIKAGGDYVRINEDSIIAIIGARKTTEFNFIFQHLKEKGFVKNETVVGGGRNTLMDVTLTFEGLEYYEKLERGNTDSRKAFMAMEYGDKELDEIVDNHFKPAVADTGFELYRLDKNPKAGLIDDRLRVEIRNSRFLIADLTHENNGAYWEAGYAEGIGKPVIYTCKKEEFNKDKPHFDTNHHLTVIWDKNKIQDTVDMLKATIRATLPGEAKLSEKWSKAIKTKEIEVQDV